jgi:GTPase Era involved in 16S rRNA processing
MDGFSTTDTEKLKELLKRTGEFIAYFEVAESKMLEWKHEMEDNFLSHQRQFEQQIKSLQQSAEEMSSIMTEAGAARWRIAAEENLKQGKNQLQLLDKKSNSIIDQLSQFCAQQEKQIEQSTKKINLALTSFDINEYKQLAQESIDSINRTSNDAVKKSEKIFSAFHIKTALLALVVSSLTALTIGLYMSDELPWEIHKHAMEERSLGKATMAAWSSLAHQERQKIIKYTAHP